MTLPVNWDRPMNDLEWNQSWPLVKQCRDMDDPRALLVMFNYNRHMASVRGQGGHPSWKGIVSPSLQWSDELANAAKFHAMQMVELGFFDHVSPHGDGPADRAQLAGYSFEVFEQFARGLSTARAVHKRWWREAHGFYAGRSFLKPEFKVMGAAQHDWHWVALFGTELP